MRFPEVDALLMAAAVSDYRPTQVEIRKIKRAHEEMTFHLTANPDILKQVAALKGTSRSWWVSRPRRTTWRPRRARKMREKHLDLIVANDVNRPDSGFQVDTNEVTLIPRVGEAVPLPLLSKEEVAAKILDQVVALLETRGRGPCKKCLKTRLRNCGNWSIVYLIGSAINGAWDGGGCRARSRLKFRTERNRRTKFPAWRKSGPRWGIAAAASCMGAAPAWSLGTGPPTPG